nr:hypothetical protein [Tanacetum cinerariifolium]
MDIFELVGASLVENCLAGFNSYILLTDRQSCVLTKSNSANFKTRLHFVSQRCCVLPKKTSCVLLKDTRPPMLDKTDFASWQQRIRLYCRGKDNEINILKSIDEGPYKLGTFRETLAESTKEYLSSHAGITNPIIHNFLPQTNNQLRTSSNPKNQATVQDGRVVVQNVQGRPNRGQGMNPRGESATGYGEAQNRVGNVNQGGLDNAFDDDVDEQPIQDLALNVDNVFQAEDCDIFDSDVDEAPTAQTMFMANLSSADPVTDKARPSYDSDILSEVQDHDQYLDDTCAYQEEHVMHD